MARKRSSGRTRAVPATRIVSRFGGRRAPMHAVVVCCCVQLILLLLEASPQASTGTESGSFLILGCRAFSPNMTAPKGIARTADATARSTSATTKTTTAAANAFSTTLRMNFVSNFFDSLKKSATTGGSYNLGIDYDALEFPGPEVGAMAAAIARTTGDEPAVVPSRSPSRPRLELATFAGGCFWGLQLAFRRCEGVEHTLVGYTQGGDDEVRPNYEQVSAGNTGHCEAVLVYYDPAVIGYEGLLRTVFLDRVDVTTVDGQGRDFGKHYRTGLYFHTPEQEETARRLLSEEAATNPRYANTGGRDRAVATEVKPAGAFWPAEAYHQRYLEKGGRFGRPQSSEKGNTDEIRCYG